VTLLGVRRYLLVRLYLGWHAAVGFGFGAELLIAPHRLVTGPSLTTVYGLRPPWQWGVLFMALAVICAVGANRPLHMWRVAIIALGVAQICWALGLLAPLLTDGRTNLLASLPWVALGVTSGIVALETDREERPSGAGG
jgi:hypothetical protein